MSDACATDLVLLPATELAQRIRARRVSPVEVVDAYLARIDAVNPALNAYVTVLADRARAAAKVAEREVSEGRVRGPLHGVPIAVKDLFDFLEGVPNTFGVTEFAGYVPEETAPHVSRLEQLGAIILGKTNTPEFGHKATTDNRLYGPTSTPFAAGHNAGGSSGGSAAAVAAGMCALAQGSDGGGSVRIPAALCGVVGLKPSFGLLAGVVRPDAFFAFNPFMGNGPLARSVEDCALMLEAMAGFDARDPGSVPLPVKSFREAIFQPARGLRVAYLPTLGGFPVAADVAAVIDTAAHALESAGVVVEQPDFTLPASHTEVTDLWLRCTGSAMIGLIETFRDAGLDLRAVSWETLPPHLREATERATTFTTADTRRDQFLRTAIFDALAAIFDRYDAIITPTTGVAAVPNATDGWTVGPTTIDDEPVDPVLGWCLTHPFNYTGSPAISVPAGMTPAGFPVGLQIAAPRFRDDTVLTLAAAFERIRPWHGELRFPR
ncbi:amidase [Nocardia sp. 2]|uniref:amidase n=1 Tax=Nocardia acididurans TaxID=2802282 RepID=A0ABS1ME33_9NOCA|nr:amidase [Nocardia acididurans]MBL1078839.1 amidase [Nocardia acididurans]